MNPSTTGPLTGDWPRWRGDALLTGHQPLPGAMAVPPRVRARYFLGASTGPVIPADLTNAGAPQDYLICAGARVSAFDCQGRLLWECRPTGYCPSQIAWVADLDADGAQEVVVLAGHVGGTCLAFLVLEGRTGKLRAACDFNSGQFGYARFCGPFVQGEPGQQILLVTSARGQGPGQWASPGRFALLGFDGERLAPRWELEPAEHLVEYPAALIGDLAGTGRTQAVVDSWCHVWNLDLGTGQVLSHTTWDPQGANQRHYGWNQLVPVCGPDRLDFVNLSLTKHVEVLAADDQGRLSLTWTRGWPDPVTTELRSLACPADPVGDVDGDHAREVVVGLFDGVVDRRWHLFAFGGATGELKGEALDLVPVALVPLGADQGHAVLCSRSTTIERHSGQGATLWRLQGGRWEELWTTDQGEVLLTDIASDERLSVGYNGLQVRRPVCCDADNDGLLEFFTQHDGRVQAWGLDPSGQVKAKPGQPPAPPPAPALPPLPQLQGKTAAYLLAADLRGQGRNHLFLGADAAVTELSLEEDRLEPVAGFDSLEIPQICPLLGDGRPVLLLGSRAPDRSLYVEALHFPPGQGPIRLWRFTLPDSQACGQYLQALYFAAGRFTGRAHLEVFAYSTKPGARAYLLDGRTGQPLWERAEIPAIERHFQAMGGRVAVWDYDGDGEDDLLFCCPDYYCVADGRTGELHVGPIFLPDLTGYWSAYSSPAVLPRPGQPPIVYLGGAYESRTSIRLDGTGKLWSEFLPVDRWGLMAGAQRFAEGLLPPWGTHGWRILQAQVDGALVCLDAATGQHCWEMQLPTASSAIATGDVDSDGRDEFLFGGQDSVLYAYRDAGDRAEEVWQVELAGPVGAPLLADLDNDGACEIAVSVGDGYLMVLDSPV